MSGKQPHRNFWLETVRQELASIQYGEILIKIQNGKVVQIEALRKLRLDGPSATTSHLTADQNTGGIS